MVESRCSPAFFPAPKGAVFGFTVDLGAAGGGAQEFLHARFDYSPKHVLKLAKWQGPTDVPDVVQCRQRHVNALRLRSGRANYGEKHWPMSAK